MIILYEDEFGRVLFDYSEDPWPSISTFNLLIIQKNDEDYVYFYPHYNFISSENPLIYVHSQIINDLRTHSFELANPLVEEKIEELKILNDWNQPLNLERAVRAPIIRRKEDSPVSNPELSMAYRVALGNATRPSPSAYSTFFKTDDYGRSIYVGRGLERGHEPGEGWIAVIMLFQPDGSLDLEKGVVQLPDFQNYQSTLRELKELNHWNQPLEE
jgi:hypothetical protein